MKLNMNCDGIVIGLLGILIDEEKYEIKMSGKTTFPKYINEVRKNLIKIYDEFGTKKYKKKWVQHEFPLDEYEKLK